MHPYRYIIHVVHKNGKMKNKNLKMKKKNRFDIVKVILQVTDVLGR